MAPTPDRPSPVTLYQDSISSNLQHYSNHHVYPYTCLAGYCYRNGLYKQAFQAWAKAADTIKQSVNLSPHSCYLAIFYVSYIEYESTNIIIAKLIANYFDTNLSFYDSYNYSRDDEEIYKEFLDIANELIPYVMRVLSSDTPKHPLLKVNNS